MPGLVLILRGDGGLKGSKRVTGSYRGESGDFGRKTGEVVRDECIWRDVLGKDRACRV